MKICNSCLYVPVLLAAVLSGGCNSDIFVDHVPGPVEQSITLDGDGGRHTVEFQRKGLLAIKVDNNFDHYAVASYYDSDGNLLPGDVSPDRIARIVYGSPRFTFEILLENAQATIVSVDNAYGPDSIVIWLDFDYGYTSRYFEITVTPGKPMSFRDMGYDMSQLQSSTRTFDYKPMNVTNNSDHVMTMNIYPYREVKSFVLFNSEELWTTGIGGAAPVPYFQDGVWSYDDTNNVDVVINRRDYFYSHYTDIDRMCPVEIPAKTTVSVYVSVTFAVAKVPFLCDFVQPNSSSSWIGGGMCEVSQPISYKVEIR